jgi:hypothetical protein
MTIPATRDDHKDWCLRQLGAPVIQINVDDDQVDDCVDLSLQYFQQFHFDGTERYYMKYLLTQTDITNNWIPIPDNIIGVNNIWPVSTTSATINMFDLRYQLRLHELYDFTSVSYVNYALTMQHIRTLDMLFSGDQPVRFNRHTNKLFLDMDWGMVSPGEYLVVDAFTIIDPEDYPKVWNDRMLKRLTTANIKKVWGNNLKKFGGMQLPGGITLNGQQIYDEATQEIEKLEEQIRLEFEAPPQFILG